MYFPVTFVARVEFTVWPQRASWLAVLPIRRLLSQPQVIVVFVFGIALGALVHKALGPGLGIGGRRLLLRGIAAADEDEDHRSSLLFTRFLEPTWSYDSETVATSASADTMIRQVVFPVAGAKVRAGCLLARAS
jgi:hypothetical protein